MAIINVELRMMIAERLANDNYREEIKEVKESLRLHLLAYSRKIIFLKKYKQCLKSIHSFSRQLRQFT